MNLHIARWGNSLALRIPAEVARHAGIKEGDRVEATLTADGTLAIRLTRWDRMAFAKELADSRNAMTIGTSVIEELRREARY